MVPYSLKNAELKDALVTRLKRGTAAQIFAQGVYILTQILSIPLFLHFWGVELYGEWLILLAIPACLAIGDFGFAGASNREMAMLVSSGNKSEALKLFRSITLIIFFLSVLLLMIVFCIVFFLPYDIILNFTIITNATAAWIILLLAFQTCIGFFTLLIYGGFNCEGRYGFGQFLLSSINFLEFTCIASILMAGCGPLYAAIAYSISRLLGTLIMFVILRCKSPWLILGFRGFKMGIVKRLTRPALAGMAFPLANALNIQGMRIAVGIVLGPIAVTIFTTLRTLSRISLMFLRSVNAIVQPEIGYAYGMGNSRLLRELHRHSFQVSLWGVIFAIVGLLLFGDWIFFHWTDGNLKMDLPLFTILIAGASINALWSSSLMVTYATNRHMQIARTFIVVNIVAVITVFISGNIFGLKGVGEIIFVAEILMAFFVIPKSILMVEDTWTDFLSIIKSPPWFLLEPLKKLKR